MTRNSDATVLQLKKPGDEATLRIESCGPMKIGTYPEIEFVGVADDGTRCAVRVPEKSADRQLERIGLTYDSAVGETLTFSRSASDDPKRPYWNIDIAADAITASTRPASAAKPAPTSAASPAETNGHANGHGGGDHPKRGAALYLDITEFALKRVVPEYVKQGIPVTMEGTAAIVATLFIQANR